MSRVWMIALAVLVCGNPLLRAEEPEPTYRGRPASTWIKFLRNRDTQAVASRLLAVGECKALPVLLEAITYEDAFTCELLLSRLGAKAVPELERRLKEGTTDQRRRAALAVAAIGPPAADLTPALIQALADPDQDLRTYAVYALHQVGPGAKAAVPGLLALIKQKPARLPRGPVLRALGAIDGQNPKLTSLFLRSLPDADPEVGRGAYAALTMGLGPTESLAPARSDLDFEPSIFGLFPVESSTTVARNLADEIDNTDGWIAKFARANKVSAVDEPRQLTPRLVAGLRSPEPRVRQLAAILLGSLRLDDADVRAALARRLHDKEDGPATVAALALVNLGEEGLRAVIESPERPPRTDPEGFKLTYDVTTSVLAERGDAAIPLLLAALKDGRPVVCKRAAKALSAVRPQRTRIIDALIAALRQRIKKNVPDDGVGNTLVEALKPFVGKNKQVIRAWAEALACPTTRSEAARQLGSCKEKAAPAAAELYQALVDGRESGFCNVYVYCAVRDVGDPMLPFLRRGLVEDKRAKVRRDIAELLGSMEQPGHLLQVLHSNSPDVRIDAITALQKVASRKDDAIYHQVAEGIAQRLQDRDARVRQQAAKTLAEFGTEQVPALAEALRDASPEVRREAAQALGKIGPAASAAVPALIAAIDDSEACKESIAALRAMGRRAGAATPALVRFIKSEADRDARRDALRALAEVAPSPRLCVPILIAHLDQSSYFVNAAIDGVQHIGPEAKAAIPALRRIIRDKRTLDPYDAARAMLALGDRSPEVVQIILAKEKFGAADAEAIAELGRDGRPAYGTLLARLRGKEKTRVPLLLLGKDAEKLAEALARIGPGSKEDVQNLLKLLWNTEPADRTLAAIALDGLGPEHSAAVPSLIKVLRDQELFTEMSDHQVRVKVIKALGNIGGPAKTAIPELRRILKDNQPLTTRFSAAYTLMQMGDAKERAEDLAAVFREASQPDNSYEFRAQTTVVKNGVATLNMQMMGAVDNPVIRVFATSCLLELGKLSTGEALPALREGLRLEEAYARERAIVTLGSLGAQAKPAVPELREALLDRDPELRRKAAAVLEKIQ